MNKKLSRILSGMAITTISASACIIPVAGSFAGEIQQNGIYGWGANTYGLLGNGSTSKVSLPTLSAKSVVNAQQVATSDTHTLFLDSKGNIYASGSNKYGQLGNGKTTNSSTPVKVTLPLRFGVPDYATQIWVGDNVSFMRGSFGDLYSWGSNSNGRTGHGLTTGNTLTPKKVGTFKVADDDKVLSVSDRQVAFIAPRTYTLDGEVYETESLFTFGANTNKVANQNSSASIVSKPTFQLISNPDEETTYEKEVCKIDTSPDAEKGDTICDMVVTKKTYDQLEGFIPSQVSVGNDFGIVTDGSTIFTWGKNNKGQLGRAVSASTISPKPTTSSALQLEDYSSPESISAGDEHALVLGSDGLIYGWGDNSRSETAPYYKGSTGSYLNVLQRLVIRKEISDNSDWTKVVATNDSSYATTTNNEVYGWGDNSSKELVQSTPQVNTPTKINFPYETQINTFAAGGNNALAITDYTETYTDLGLKNAGNTITSGSVHTAYNYSVSSIGGYPGKAHKWTIYGLPKGLTYSSTTGKISGTPTQVGTFDIEVNLSDNVDTVSHNYTLTIKKSTPTLSATYSSTTPGKATAKIKVSKGAYVASGGSYTLTYGTKKVTGKLDTKGEATVNLAGTYGSKVATKVTYAGNSLLNSTSSSSSITFAKKRNATMSATYSSPNPGQVRSVVTVKDGKNNATGYVYMTSGKLKSSKVKLVNGKATVTWGGLGYGKNVKVNVVYEGSSINNAKTLASKTVKTLAKRNASVSATYSSPNPGQVRSVVTVKDGKNNATGYVYMTSGKSKSSKVKLVNGKATVTWGSRGYGKNVKVNVVYEGSSVNNAKTLASKTVKTLAKRNASVSATYSSPHPGQVRSVVTVKDGKNNATGYVYMTSGKSKSTKVKLVNGKATVTWGGRGYGKNVKVNVVYEGSSYNNAKTLASKTVKTKAKYSSVPSVAYKVNKKVLTTTVTVPTKSGLVPTGKVYLYDGTKKVGTATISKGKATFKTTLKKGTHKMKVTYAGNTYFNAKTSAVKSVKIK